MFCNDRARSLDRSPSPPPRAHLPFLKGHMFNNVTMNSECAACTTNDHEEATAYDYGDRDMHVHPRRHPMITRVGRSVEHAISAVKHINRGHKTRSFERIRPPPDTCHSGIYLPAIRCYSRIVVGGSVVPAVLRRQEWNGGRAVRTKDGDRSLAATIICALDALVARVL